MGSEPPSLRSGLRSGCEGSPLFRKSSPPLPPPRTRCARACGRGLVAPSCSIKHTSAPSLQPSRSEVGSHL